MCDSARIALLLCSIFLDVGGKEAAKEQENRKEVLDMSKKQNKMFMGVAGISLACLVAMGMAGCAGNTENVNENANDGTAAVAVEEDQAVESDADEKTAEEELAAPAELEVADFGWFVSSNGMVDFSVAIENPNKYIAADSATVTVSGLDKDGNVVFTEDIPVASIAPESDYVFSYVTGANNGSGQATAPDDLSITVTVPEDGWTVYNPNEAVQYEVTDVAVAPSDIEGTDVFSGSVSSKSDSKDVEDGQAMVNVVLYDQNGKMLGGYFDIVDMGQENPTFEVYAIEAPEYNDYKVFVSPYTFVEEEVATDAQ